MMYRDKLEQYYHFLSDKYGEDRLLGVFLYGSQNYGLAGEGSDVDAYAIYVPTLDEVARLDKPVSTTFEFECGNVTIKDVRLMCQMWKKQGINFVEILFTEYYLINQRYEDSFNTVRKFREYIATYDMQQAVKSAIHSALNGLKGPYVTSKQYINGMRTLSFIQNYILGRSYLNCIVVPDNRREQWKEIKFSNEVYECGGVRKTKVDYLKADLEDLLEFTVDDDTPSWVKEEIDNVLIDFCKECLLNL